MLILTRYIGEAVLIGQLRVVVLDINRDQVRFKIGSETVWLAQGIPFAMGDVSMVVTKIKSCRQIGMGFQAPRSISIMRNELVEGLGL